MFVLGIVFSINHKEAAFTPRTDILQTTQAEWETMTEESFKLLSQASPIKRAKLQGMQRNVQFIKKA